MEEWEERPMPAIVGEPPATAAVKCTMCEKWKSTDQFYSMQTLTGKVWCKECRRYYSNTHRKNTPIYKRRKQKKNKINVKNYNRRRAICKKLLKDILDIDTTPFEAYCYIKAVMRLIKQYNSDFSKHLVDVRTKYSKYKTRTKVEESINYVEDQPD